MGAQPPAGVGGCGRGFGSLARSRQPSRQCLHPQRVYICPPLLTGTWGGGMGRRGQPQGPAPSLDCSQPPCEGGLRRDPLSHKRPRELAPCWRSHLRLSEAPPGMPPQPARQGRPCSPHMLSKAPSQPEGRRNQGQLSQDPGKRQASSHPPGPQPSVSRGVAGPSCNTGPFPLWLPHPGPRAHAAWRAHRDPALGELCPMGPLQDQP